MLRKIDNKRPEFFDPLDLLREGGRSAFLSYSIAVVSTFELALRSTWFAHDRNPYVQALQEPPTPPGFVQCGCVLFARDFLAGDGR
jgi:hypothetical protein